MKFIFFVISCFLGAILLLFPISSQAKNRCCIVYQTDTTTTDSASSSSTSFSVDIATDYIWRDLVYGFNVLQPTVEHNFKRLPLSFSMWSSAQVRFQTNDIEFSSTLSYALVSTDESAQKKRSKNISSQFIDIGAGIVHYAIPLDTSLEGSARLETNSAELFSLFSYTRWPIIPSAEVYVDISGPIYYAFSLSGTLFPKKKYNFDLGVITGFRERERLIPDDNLQHFTGFFTLPLPFFKDVEANLFGNYIYRFKLKDQNTNIGITINF